MILHNLVLERLWLFNISLGFIWAANGPGAYLSTKVGRRGVMRSQPRYACHRMFILPSLILLLSMLDERDDKLRRYGKVVTKLIYGMWYNTKIIVPLTPP